MSAYSAVPMVGLSGPVIKGLLKSFKGKKLSALLKLLKELLEKINLKKMLDGVDSLIDTLVDGAKRASKAMKETLEKIKDKMVEKAKGVAAKTKVNTPDNLIPEGTSEIIAKAGQIQKTLSDRVSDLRSKMPK